ncbi:MAG: hypothetical protein JRM74_04210 [Nitrososphaerota archaeon]|nr:hypothetical protein [Nitrososphaerota archaeon]MDG6962277.1 hypothetical protein [Nitrososphaerota archaeon]MDG6969386.1 hypothetical protein [Nitrososphaerota archaeon]MDG6973006.1 hypothetical protein [Nitrososphaerota archaeon]MDG6982640.1 hypothetical protein [Nitrososphaerota archaeon]
MSHGRGPEGAPDVACALAESEMTAILRRLVGRRYQRLRSEGRAVCRLCGLPLKEGAVVSKSDGRHFKLYHRNCAARSGLWP